MPEKEKGRLCLKCNHTIIDFRNKTDSEIAESHLYSNNKVCGLYSKKQLAKPSEKIKSKKKNKFLSIYIGLLTFFISSSYGQDKSKTVKTEQTEKNYDSFDEHNRLKLEQKDTNRTDSICITGNLTDTTGATIPFANVLIYINHQYVTGTSSDINGNYRLESPLKVDSVEHLLLKYSGVGFNQITKTIDLKSIGDIKHLVVNAVFSERSEITSFAIEYQPPFYERAKYKIRNFFKRKK